MCRQTRENRGVGGLDFMLTKTSTHSSTYHDKVQRVLRIWTRELSKKHHGLRIYVIKQRYKAIVNAKLLKQGNRPTPTPRAEKQGAVVSVWIHMSKKGVAT